MNSVLNVVNAVKSFGSTKALDAASFELCEGEWLALLGPNGAGKTTIVRSIAGRVRLDSGKIALVGAQLNGSRDAMRRKPGIVPPGVALYPRLAAQDNV